MLSPASMALLTRSCKPCQRATPQMSLPRLPLLRSSAGWVQRPGSVAMPNSGDAGGVRYKRSISFAVVKILVLLVAVWVLASSISLAEPPAELLPPPLPSPSVTKQKLIIGLAGDPPFVIHESGG